MRNKKRDTNYWYQRCSSYGRVYYQELHPEWKDRKWIERTRGRTLFEYILSKLWMYIGLRSEIKYRVNKIEKIHDRIHNMCTANKELYGSRDKTIMKMRKTLDDNKSRIESIKDFLETNYDRSNRTEDDQINYQSFLMTIAGCHCLLLVDDKGRGILRGDTYKRDIVYYQLTKKGELIQKTSTLDDWRKAKPITLHIEPDYLKKRGLDYILLDHGLTP